MFKLEIETGGAAFKDEDGNFDINAYEVRRLLKEIDRKLQSWYNSGYLMDINGNKVGHWSYD